MNFRTNILTLALWCGTLCSAHAQEMSKQNLFEDRSPLSIKLAVSIHELRKKTNDSTYIPAVLSFKNDSGVWDSIPVSIRTRGNFRKAECSYPPLRIKIKKKDAANTLFEGIKALKLVLPCYAAKSGQDLINKEYLCYKLYEPITPVYFRTRLLDITLVEKGKREKISQINGFFIEDDDPLAERHQAKVIDETKINPLQLEDTSAMRQDLFQYMIANTDFSTTFFHNIKVIRTEKGRYIPVPYDFDMSGIVNPPYATIDPKWEIKSVRERVYKGYCRNEKVAEYVRQEFIGREENIYSIIDLHQNLLGPKETESLKKYVGGFFAILKNDHDYRDLITAKCRKQ
ncbi:MAG TPA: hypothetical protein VIU13_15505 [Chryseolinea sp.]